MGIEIEGTDIIKKYSKKYLKEFRQAFESEVADMALDIVKRTVSENVDANGVAFKGYSKGYYKYGEPVNLSVDGLMLGAITSKFTQRRGANVYGRIFFSNGDQAKKAKGHMTGTYWGRKTGKIRRFFALSNEQREGFAKRVQQKFRSNLKGIR